MSASLEITRGDDELIRFLVQDPEDQEPVNLTGCSLWFYIKASTAALDTAAILAKGPTDIEIDPDQTTNKGKATLALVPADTASIALIYLDRQLKYEVQLEDGAGKISTVAKGTIVVKSDVVRTTT